MKSGIPTKIPQNLMLFWLEVFPQTIRSILIGEWISYPDLVYLSSVVKSRKAKENLTILVRQFCKEIVGPRLVSVAEAKWISCELGVSMKCQSVDISVLSDSKANSTIHHLTLANMSLFSNVHQELIAASKGLERVEVSCNDVTSFENVIELVEGKQSKCSFIINCRQWSIHYDAVDRSLLLKYRKLYFPAVEFLQGFPGLVSLSFDVDSPLLRPDIMEKAIILNRSSLTRLSISGVDMEASWLLRLPNVVDISSTGQLVMDIGHEEVLKRLQHVSLSSFVFDNGQLTVLSVDNVLRLYFPHIASVRQLVMNCPLYDEVFMSQLLESQAVTSHLRVLTIQMPHREEEVAKFLAFTKHILNVAELTELMFLGSITLVAQMLDTVLVSHCCTTLQLLDLFCTVPLYTGLVIPPLSPSILANFKNCLSLREFRLKGWGARVGLDDVALLAEGLKQAPVLEAVRVYPLFSEEILNGHAQDHNLCVQEKGLVPIQQALPCAWWRSVVIYSTKDANRVRDASLLLSLLSAQPAPFRLMLKWDIPDMEKWFTEPLSVRHFEVFSWKHIPSGSSLSTIFENWRYLCEIKTPLWNFNRCSGEVKLNFVQYEPAYVHASEAMFLQAWQGLPDVLTLLLAQRRPVYSLIVAVEPLLKNYCAEALTWLLPRLQKMDRFVFYYRSSATVELLASLHHMLPRTTLRWLDLDFHDVRVFSNSYIDSENGRALVSGMKELIRSRQSLLKVKLRWGMVKEMAQREFADCERPRLHMDIC